MVEFELQLGEEAAVFCYTAAPVVTVCIISGRPWLKCGGVSLSTFLQDQTQSVIRSARAEWEIQTTLLKSSHHCNICTQRYNEKHNFVAKLLSRVSPPFCQTGGWVPDKAPVWIPSSSLTEVWSAQTWTLGTLFTHIIVTCKPPCRKHKIHLYILNLQAMTAQTEQGEKKKTERRKKTRKEMQVWSRAVQSEAEVLGQTFPHVTRLRFHSDKMFSCSTCGEQEHILS